jgi:hypothetical protein
MELPRWRMGTEINSRHRLLTQNRSDIGRRTRMKLLQSGRSEILLARLVYSQALAWSAHSPQPLSG